MYPEEVGNSGSYGSGDICVYEMALKREAVSALGWEEQVLQYCSSSAVYITMGTVKLARD
jgi:hypothetical protein